jgi:hypothetical protein
VSLRWRDRRRELFGKAKPQGEARRKGSAPRDELRRDWSAPRARRRRRIVWAPIFAATVISLLALAALRVSILRTRYALGETLQRETELLGRERSAAVAAREERDPHRLRELAAERGFGRPERVIDLSAPEPRR